MWLEFIARIAGILFSFADRAIAVPANFIGLTTGGILKNTLAVFVVTVLLAIVGLCAIAAFQADGNVKIFLGTLFGTPWMATSATWLTLLIMISVNRAWSQNEGARSDIADGYSKQNADDLPDLRLLALISAVIALLLLPFLFYFSNASACSTGLANCLFKVSGHSFGVWVLHSADLVVKVVGFFGVTDVYGFPSPTDVVPVVPNAKHLLMFARLVVAFVFLSTFFELYRITTSVARAAKSLDEGPDRMARIGQRAIPDLVVYLRENTGLGNDPRITPAEDPNRVARNAAEALGMIGSRVPLRGLMQVASQRSLNDYVRRRAVNAIVKICERQRAKLQRSWVLERWLIQRALSVVELWAHDLRTSEQTAREVENKSGKGVVVESLDTLLSGFNARHEEEVRSSTDLSSLANGVPRPANIALGAESEAA